MRELKIQTNGKDGKKKGNGKAQFGAGMPTICPEPCEGQNIPEQCVPQITWNLVTGTIFNCVKPVAGNKSRKHLHEKFKGIPQEG